MSLDATIWAWKKTGISPAAKLILLWISDSSDEFGIYYSDPFSLQEFTGCDPCSLQEFTGCDPDEINELISELKVSGLIQNVSLSTDISVYKLLGYQP